MQHLIMSPDKIYEKYPSLTPIVAPWMREVTENRSLIEAFFQQYDSPVNLHNTDPFVQNYEEYHELLDYYSLKHRIFYARKANKCRSFANAARRRGFGVDTASYNELKQCLELGCDPARLVVSAAVKNEKLVRLAVKNEVLIILDNEDECRRINTIAQKLEKKAAVGIRISGFVLNGEKLYSRFGFDINEATEFIAVGLKNFENLDYRGLHFHLDGYSIEQRAEAIIQVIELSNDLQEKSILTSFIDIGGGLLVSYIADKNEWEHFWNELKKAVQGERPLITFGNNGLGHVMIGDELHGAPEVYPYYNDKPKAKFLDEVLNYKNKEGQAVFELLRDCDIELRMEPGRSLLDQAGMTMAKVAHRKQDQHGNWLVGLEMNRSQLFSSSADFLVDPIFITMEPARKPQPVPVYFTGGYCLEGDIILKRKIVLPQLPAAGDVIVFPNTAGYMMHFYETESHLFNKATNLVKDEYKSSGFKEDEF